MGGQIVHDNDIARPQRRDQDLFDIGEKSGPVHRSVEDHGRGHPRQAERAGEGRRLPVAVRDRRPAALSLRRASAQARHLRRRAGLVDEHEPVRIEIELGLEPDLALTPHVGTLLLAGVRRFF